MSWQDYPFVPEPWGITREGLDLDRAGVDETLFALGNGELGVRASFEQGDPEHQPGALLNGFYEAWDIVYPEPAFGYASQGQTIVNLPDASRLSVSWNGQVLDLRDAEVRRRLDFRTGILTTTAKWPQLTARWERLVSFDHSQVLAMKLSVDTREEGEIEVRTHILNQHDLERSGEDVQYFEPGEEVDPRQAPEFGRRLLQRGDQVATGKLCVLTYRTTESDLPLAVASRVESSLDATGWTIKSGDRAWLELRGGPGRHEVEVVVAYRRDDVASAAQRYIENVGGFDQLASAQEQALQTLWNVSDIEIEGDPRSQQAIRFAIFQLHQASARVGRRGIAARGLSGRTYEGHYFWDSAVFVLPVLSVINPAAAEEVIRWRHSTLPEARERAVTMSVDGALFPWRTINGEEASAFFEAGSAQFHINADVIFGLRSYLVCTGDDQTLWDCGVEMAIETARMWASLGFWDDDGFHIHGVTGPDEYTALVNDNAFTNQMARMNLRFAVDAVARMHEEQERAFDELADSIGFRVEEADEWTRIADGIVVLHDDDLGVTAQDATFMTLEPWNWTTPAEKYPLLLHFHPLVLYRHQMLKQADVVMAHFLLPDDTPIDQRRSDFDYYDPITTGDSSLSAAIQAAVGARVGRPEQAWRYFCEAATLDLADRAGNAADGFHLATIAGTWSAVVRGFVGLEIDWGGEVSSDPRLPEGWESVTINLIVQGEPVRIRVEAP